MTRDVRLVFLGFGNVGRALARLLLEKHAHLHSRYGLRLLTVGILTHRHGTAIHPAGIDLTKAVAAVESGSSLASLGTAPAPEDVVASLSLARGDVLLESTPVNYQTGQPALGYLRSALELGMHAITANKGPVVHGYRSLTDLALRQDRRFLFESAVMDGAPIFSLWREALPAAHLISFRGILNSTTNLILTLMEQGQTYEQALAHAQSIGIAETDPSGDILGWDAAVKVAALATVLMDQPLIPSGVSRQGIENITPADVQQATRQGKRWKLICQASRTAQGVAASVRPELVDSGDPLFTVMGTSSAVTFATDVLPQLTITEGNPGTATTAYGMLADLLRASGVL